MEMLNVGKQFIFDAAHFIEGHPTCGVMHGHTWKLEVVLLDCKPGKNGMVIDFKVLGGIVKDLLNKFDHKIINDVVEFRPVTAETLVQYLAHKIIQHIEVLAPETQYKEIYCKLQEGEGGYAGCRLEV